MFRNVSKRGTPRGGAPPDPSAVVGSYVQTSAVKPVVSLPVEPTSSGRRAPRSREANVILNPPPSKYTYGS